MGKRGLFCILMIILALTSCYSHFDDTIYSGNSSYRPLLMDTATLFKSIVFGAPRDINSRGKIWVDGTRLFVVEKFKGIHFFDNTNPAAPKQTGFLNVPGCEDISTIKDILYANNAVDLLVINISDLYNPSVIRRKRNVFLAPAPPDDMEIQRPYNNIPRNAVIIGWQIYFK